MKKIVSVLLAFVMMLGISMNLTAAETGDHVITLSGAKPGHVYEAYQIFQGNLNEDETILSNIEWGEGIDGETFLAMLTKETAYKDCGNAEDVAEVLAGFSDDSAQLDAFADLAKKHLMVPAGSSSYQEGTKTYTISGLKDGYYLVKDAAPIGDNDAATKFILEVVKDITVEVKSDVPVLEKYIMEDGEQNKANSAAIGDKVNYQLTSGVPEMDGYERYYFVIHDTFSEGLTFQNDVTVTIGEVLLGEEDFTVTADDENMKIVIHDFISYKGQAGDSITISYSAIVNEKAVIGTEGNENMAYLQYSNDPNMEVTGEDEPGPDDGNVTGETPKSYTVTYAAGIQLTKTDDSEEARILTGAKFEITGTKINQVKIVKDGQADFYVKEENVTAQAEVGANGVLSFQGLAAGEYVIKEIKAPDGYNLLKDTIRVKITCEYPKQVETGDEAAVWNYTVEGAIHINETEAPDGIVPLKVVNRAGLVFPSTGGIGTTAFYMTGIILAAAAILVKKSRVER